MFFLMMLPMAAPIGNTTLKAAQVMVESVPVASPTFNAAQRCFIDPVWSASDIQITRDIPYGSNYNNLTGKVQTLLLDIYQPPDSDNRTMRPGFVLVHGGSFMTGDKSSDGEPLYAVKLAQRGFVVVSIDYRLTGQSTQHLSVSTRPEEDATEDARAAIRAMRAHADQFRVDSDRIAISGDSAGAITSLWLGYVKGRAQQNGTSGNPGYSSDVRLAAPISGTMKFQAFCKYIHPAPSDCAVNAVNDYTGDVDGKPHPDGSPQPALLMVHGTEDYTLPFVNAQAVAAAAAAAGIPSKLIAIQGAGHVPFTQLYEGGRFDEFMAFVVEAMDLSHAQCPHAYKRQ